MKQHYFQNGVYFFLFPNLQLFNLKLIPFYCDYRERHIYIERDRMRDTDIDACIYRYRYVDGHIDR